MCIQVAIFNIFIFGSCKNHESHQIGGTECKNKLQLQSAFSIRLKWQFLFFYINKNII